MPAGPDKLLVFIPFEQFHIEAEGLEFLDKNVEGFWKPRLKGVLAFDDGLVHPRPARHVVGLDGQEFLKRIAAP
jgi:hypothetical protein